MKKKTPWQINIEKVKHEIIKCKVKQVPVSAKMEKLLMQAEMNRMIEKINARKSIKRKMNLMARYNGLRAKYIAIFGEDKDAEKD